MSAAMKRVKRMFDDRMVYEALWDTAYRYMAPERQVFFRKEGRSPNEIQESVFDSTAIDMAERLANILLSRLTPPWQRWFRLEPGTDIQDPRLREQLRPMLQAAEKQMFMALDESNFYQEVQPMLIDRIIGGTGAMQIRPDFDAGKVIAKCVPLAEIAIQEDNSGRISGISRRGKWCLRDLLMAHSPRLPVELLHASPSKNMDSLDYTVYEASFRTPDGLWEEHVLLDGQGAAGVTLSVETVRFPTLTATRWTKIPGTPYGRGPGLRALADVRALNKVKELSLKNAVKVVAGAYMVVDDGVLNPYTLEFAPGAFIPVASNDPRNPSIAPFPVTGNFDVGMFQMDQLRSGIREVFLADQFGDLSRTPRSATEVAERATIVAQELGATVSRLQHELLTPMLRSVFYWMGQMRQLPPDLDIDGRMLRVDFVSQLAQAQQLDEERNLMEFMQIAAGFGQIDSKAGLIIDVHKALRVIAESKGIPAEVLRNEDEIDGMMAQAAEAQAAGAVTPEQAPPSFAGV